MIGSAIMRGRNWSLALLFVAGALNIFDRQIVNILAQAIKVDLSISDTQLGLLTGTAFGLFYSVLGIPLGRLADRVDRVKLIAAAMALWSAFTALSAAAGSFAQLFMTRLGVGVGGAGAPRPCHSFWATPRSAVFSGFFSADTWAPRGVGAPPSWSPVFQGSSWPR